MSMLEVHDLIMRTYYGDCPADLTHPPLQRKPSDEVAMCYGTSVEPGMPPEEFARHCVNGRYTVLTRWLFIHYVPRNDFFARTNPLPKTQGTHWDWSDYWCWEDAQTPRRWLYRNFTDRRSDLNWTLNQVRFDATLTGQPGTLGVQMGTFTPYLDTFLVKMDEQDWKPCWRGFNWKLHPGINRVEMRTRNNAGVADPVSFLEVEYNLRQSADSTH